MPPTEPTAAARNPLPAGRAVPGTAAGPEDGAAALRGGPLDEGSRVSDR